MVEQFNISDNLDQADQQKDQQNKSPRHREFNFTNDADPLHRSDSDKEIDTEDSEQDKDTASDNSNISQDDLADSEQADAGDTSIEDTLIDQKIERLNEKKS